MAESRITLRGRPDVEVAVKRSRRARRLSLRVSSLDGRVTLTMPSSVGDAEARAFAEDRGDWIADALARIPVTVAVQVGITLPVEGHVCHVKAGPRAARDGDRLIVPETRAGPAARGLLRTLARDRLAAASDRYAAILDRPYAKLTLRDTRSRWGSCTSDGRLMYSWRLAMAPPQVLDYVAAHEVAHLARMDHSPAFWRIVGDLCPDWRAQRDWLRAEGGALHRYHFGD